MTRMIEELPSVACVDETQILPFDTDDVMSHLAINPFFQICVPG